MKLNIEFDLKEDLDYVNPILHKNMPRFSKARVTITSEGIKYRQKDFDDVDEAIRETKYDTQSVINDIQNYMRDNAEDIRSRLSKNSGGDGVSADGWRNY